MPSVKTVLRHKTGIMFVDEPQMWEDARRDAHAAIFGVGGWDGCAAGVAAHCRELEAKYGVPTAPISSARFAEYVEQDARNHGMRLRFSYVPYPLVGRPREVLRAYVEGNDPVTDKPLMPQIVEALTRPLSAEERNPVASRGTPRPQLLKPDPRTIFVSCSWRTAGRTALPSCYPPRSG
jgi:hypothetical protein